MLNDLRRRRPLENRPQRTKTCITSSKMSFETIMVGHLGVFVKVLYFVQAFISNVGLRNVLGTISEFSVRSQESWSEFLICHSFKKKFLEKVAR